MATETTIKMMMPKSVHPLRRAKKLADKIKEAMDNIESGSEHVEEDWEVLRKANNALLVAERSDKRWTPLLDKVEATMLKYGAYGDAEGACLLDEPIDITKLKKVV